MDLLDQLSVVFARLSLIPSPRQLLQLPLLAPFAPSSWSDEYDNQRTLALAPACQHPQLSCPAELPPEFDECCLNAPSGHFLSTQFWDTSPALGANDTWTLHGLWPDYCSGGFEQYCDDARSKSQDEIEGILERASASTHPGLLDFMSQHWLSFDQRNSHLWTHEWNKHGTCISTLKPKCYDDEGGYLDNPASEQSMTTSSSLSSSPRDILDYFQQATSLYSTLDTYKTLAEHEITPSHEVTYKLSEIQDAIKSSLHGHDVTLKCNSRHELQEVWYHFLVRGPLRDASPSHSSSSSSLSSSIFVPTDADGQISNCPTIGVKYIPKGPPSKSPGKPSPPGPNPNPTPFVGKGHLKVHVLSADDDEEQQPNRDERNRQQLLRITEYKGCLIRPGTWYTSGTCATYTAKTDVKAASSDHSSADQPDKIQEHMTTTTITTADDDSDDDDKDHLFTLQSSFAPCAVLEGPSRHGQKGQFVCARNLPVQTIFGAANSSADANGDDDVVVGKVLSYKGKTKFYADHVPGRFEKVSLFADDDEGRRTVQVEIHWESSS